MQHDEWFYSGLPTCISRAVCVDFVHVCDVG